MLYHETQVAALCGVHCINTLLQGPFFSELDLAQIGRDLDQMERQMLGDAAVGAGTNVDESGMFSIQVLTKALQVWGLNALNVDSEEVQQAPQGFEAHNEEAFICNLQEHWFTIRKVDGEYWNFNSLYPAPEALSAFYLTAYLDSLKEQGYTIFVVRGQLPASPAATGALDMEGPGKWWTAEETRTAHEAAQAARQLGRARKGMEDAMARAAASGGTLTLRTGSKRRAARRSSDAAGIDSIDDDDDADLAAAIAASMQEQGSTAAAVRQPTAGASSYAAVAAAGTGLHSQPVAAAEEYDGGFEHDDPELAAALTASLQDLQQSKQAGATARQQQHLQQHQEQTAAFVAESEEKVPQQVQTAQAVQVPDEPEEGSEGALTVGFRLPSGGRLLRRFHKADTVSALAAFVAHHLATQGELGARQHVELSTQFPAKIFSHDMQDRLEAVGIEDRSMLNVAVKS